MLSLSLTGCDNSNTVQNDQTPYIGENGNWWIGDTDLGVSAQGSQGEQGIPGINGKDGTSLLTGNGEPSSELGIKGDSYIDLNTWNFYIKEENGWVARGNIKGEDGKNASADHNGTEGLEFYTINDTECAVSVGKAKLLKEITIPSKYKNYTITTVIDNGFRDCSNLEKIIIPDTVTSIGDDAFSHCSSLSSITIPEGVTSMGRSAFSDCKMLKSVTFSEGSQLTSIGDDAFSYCSSLSSIIFTGTKKQWNVISKGYYWNQNIGTYVVHCTDGDINK